MRRTQTPQKWRNFRGLYHCHCSPSIQDCANAWQRRAHVDSSVFQFCAVGNEAAKAPSLVAAACSVTSRHTMAQHGAKTRYSTKLQIQQKFRAAAAAAAAFGTLAVAGGGNVLEVGSPPRPLGADFIDTTVMDPLACSMFQWNRRPACSPFSGRRVHKGGGGGCLRCCVQPHIDLLMRKNRQRPPRLAGWRTEDGRAQQEKWLLLQQRTSS